MSEPAHSRLDLPAGYRVGEWTLTGRIGAGSWGVVYAAERADGTEAAVKFLPTHLLPPGQRASMEQLVRREVRFSLETDHPHLVSTREVRTVRDPDRPEIDGVTALVMDRAAHSLQELLAARRSSGEGPLALPEAARVLSGVGAGLAHIHGRGWVHGDLKPGNVLLAPGGEVWLGDFGLTVELDGTHAYVPPLGSLDHVPPEWWSDREGGRSTVRPTADIWAFGVLAHQVLTGGLHPFPGSTARARALGAQAYARGGAPLRLDNTVPDGWRELIGDCLRPDHASRAALDAAALAERARKLVNPGPGPGHRCGAQQAVRHRAVDPDRADHRLRLRRAGPARRRAAGGRPPAARQDPAEDLHLRRGHHAQARRPHPARQGRPDARPGVPLHRRRALRRLRADRARVVPAAAGDPQPGRHVPGAAHHCRQGRHERQPRPRPVGVRAGHGRAERRRHRHPLRDRPGGGREHRRRPGHRGQRLPPRDTQVRHARLRERPDRARRQRCPRLHADRPRRAAGQRPRRHPLGHRQRGAAPRAGGRPRPRHRPGPPVPGGLRRPCRAPRSSATGSSRRSTTRSSRAARAPRWGWTWAR